jgi:hypothetical protein
MSLLLLPLPPHRSLSSLARQGSDDRAHGTRHKLSEQQNKAKGSANELRSRWGSGGTRRNVHLERVGIGLGEVLKDDLGVRRSVGLEQGGGGLH